VEQVVLPAMTSTLVFVMFAHHKHLLISMELAKLTADLLISVHSMSMAIKFAPNAPLNALTAMEVIEQLNVIVAQLVSSYRMEVALRLVLQKLKVVQSLIQLFL